jgi:hypothetical protein
VIRGARVTPIRGTLATLMDCGLPKLAFTLGPEYAKLGE